MEGRYEVDVSYGAALGRAWARARRMLFDPFELRTWIVLGFTAWLARLAGGGGGGGTTGVRDLGAQGWREALREIPGELGEAWRELWSEAWVGPLVLLGIVMVIVLVLLLLWLSSRGKVVFYDNVATGTAAVVEPWRRLGRIGDSLFLFRLAFAAAVLGVVVAIAALAWTLGGSPLGLAVVAALGLAAAAVTVFAAILLDSFVVPIMVRSQIGALAAWDVLLPWLSRHPWVFVAYALFLVGLLILAGLVVAAAGLLTCCILFVVLALPFVGTVVLLPALVTYRALGPEVLAALDPGFAGLLSPLPPTRSPSAPDAG